MNNNTNSNEEKILKFWKENKIYQKIQEKNKNNKLFNHIDGPPYVTGDAHLGHLRNWALKDSILRFKRSCGYQVYAKEGYDTHGLPIENKVQQLLGLKTVDELKKFGEENFVKECKIYVAKIIGSMQNLRERYGLWMDKDFYQTCHPDYLSLAWKFFKIADEKNLLYKDFKTVAWCPNDQTTLSDYEIKDTYITRKDPSIYVKFQIKENFRKTKYNESLVIWTTTPWTLQSNMAIAVNPKYDYSYVLVEINKKKEVLILANSLIENVIKIISKTTPTKYIKTLKTIKGAELEGLKYTHIYLEETPSQKEFAKSSKEEHKHIHSVILANYVTLDEGEDILDKLEKKGNYKHENQTQISNTQKSESEFQDGTGLVHIAPGHGDDDFKIGKIYNLPIFCPVGPNGKLTEGIFKGKYFKDVDPLAITYLTKKGFLLHSAIKSHRYPCCWRCKTPICYRATDQWWIKRSETASQIIKENSNVKWYPNFAKNLFNNLMLSAGDWPISRQRYWGIPLPIFTDEDGNYEVFGSKEELEKRINKKLNDIHLDDLKNLEIKNKITNKIMKPVPFTADVWFDSGCASFASHYGEGLNFEEIIKKYYPIKFITEGQDQIRGWFSSLFNVGYIVTGKAPYNEVLYHQFIMTKDGKKMSKSEENGLTGKEAIEKFGADKTRFYLLSKRLAEDQINFDEQDFQLINSMFNTLENLSKFMNSYLNDYQIKHINLNLNSLDIEDKWILYKLNKTIESFSYNMKNYKINIALGLIDKFLIKDLSKIYLKIVKNRCEQRDDNLIIIFEKILKNILILFSSSIPYICENLYQQLNLFNKKKSIFLEDFPMVDSLLIKDFEFKQLDKNFDISQNIIVSILNAREKAKIGVRWPLSEVNIISTQDLKLKLLPFEKLIKKLTNISKINYEAKNVELNFIIKPNFATLKQDFKTNIQEVIKTINLNKFYIGEDLKNGEKFGVYNGLEFNLEKHIIKEVEISGEFISSEFDIGNIILHIHQDEILLEQGYLRELIRRIQQIRKENNLDKKEQINLSFFGSDNYFLELVSNWQSVISKKVGAEQILEKKLKNKYEFKIKEKNLILSLEKL